MFKVVFNGFSWVYDTSWSQSSQNGVPIVLMMLPYEARARASYRKQLGPHFGPFSVKLERTGPGKPKKHPRSQEHNFFSSDFSIRSINRAWLGGQVGQWPGRHLPPGPK